ncbi:MAG: hypothetical protein RIG63_10850 [Coleofasciculus chthonoplastes F3-SA18-01]|uniref:hypothetical protein n=1 Tax=Coleofasciculus chthonoplastes TaxID=64178 RepID=UPI0032F866D5
MNKQAIIVYWVRSLLTSFCVNLCHLSVSPQQNVIQSVSLMLSQRIWSNTSAIAWACCICQVHLRM